MSKTKYLDLAILHCYKTGDGEVANEANSELATLQAEYADLRSQVTAAKEALPELAQAVDDNSGEGENFKVSLHSVAMELRKIAAALDGAK